MRKREFLKTGIVGILGIASMRLTAGYSKSIMKNGVKFQIPRLKYPYEALEPYFNSSAIQQQHLIQHAGYAHGLNAAIGAEYALGKRARYYLKNASKYPARITRNAGGYVNHNIFWKSLSPSGGGSPSGKIARLIDRDFGSFGAFKSSFRKTVLKHSSPGWAWLVIDRKKLKVVITHNLDNPIMDTLPDSKKGFPLLGLDLGEHACPAQYKDHRSEYIDAFWSVVNWDMANRKINKYQNT